MKVDGIKPKFHETVWLATVYYGKQRGKRRYKFTIAELGNQPRCQSTDERIKKM
jgi:hypothetical protein